MQETYTVKCAQLDLLKELKRVCQKNNLQYFLVGGTLLGAIRHNGFIPWDDDIDVAMMRDQYDKFMKACQQDLDDAYELTDWYTDPLSPIPFAKLKIKGSHYTEKLAQKTRINDGIFIDIFPLDAIPDNHFWQKQLWNKTYLIKKILLLKCGIAIDENKNIIKKFLYLILRCFSNMRSVEGWKHRYDEIVESYSDINSNYVISYGGVYSFAKERKTRRMLSEFEYHMFEDDWFLIPKQYDAYLRSHYGDYMQIPPLSQREGRHNILYISLGDYEVKSKLKSRDENLVE